MHQDACSQLACQSESLATHVQDTQAGVPGEEGPVPQRRRSRACVQRGLLGVLCSSSLILQMHLYRARLLMLSQVLELMLAFPSATAALVGSEDRSRAAAALCRCVPPTESLPELLEQLTAVLIPSEVTALCSQLGQRQPLQEMHAHQQQVQQQPSAG